MQCPLSRISLRHHTMTYRRRSRGCRTLTGETEWNVGKRDVWHVWHMCQTSDEVPRFKSVQVFCFYPSFRRSRH